MINGTLTTGSAGQQTDIRHTNMIFTLEQNVGSLAEALDIFKQHDINLSHIESRPSRRFEKCYEFLVEFDSHAKCEKSQADVHRLFDCLKSKSKHVMVHDNEERDAVPWFPKKIRDLDAFANRILSYGSELDADHPGFTDQVYRARRKELADVAFNYRYGQKIPTIKYTEEEIKTWSIMFRKLRSLFTTHACKEFNYIFPLLEQNCGYNENNIPQLQDISDFLKDCTGFTLRPVAGLLSPRDFLAGLAFRVFHSTQYMRHPTMPFYTPEPDVCHELFGHVPLFADPDFAQFSQEIGLASLGAPDEDIEKLSTLYWFTIEFGLCIQDGETKAYGAGLLSSFGELEYCMSDKPVIRPFDPSKTAVTAYPISTFQPIYYLAESFNDAKNKVIDWALTIRRPFSVRYNPYTQSVETVDKSMLIRMVQEIKNELVLINDALNHVTL